MRTEQGQIIRLKDYRKPDYSVEKVELTFRLDKTATRITARLGVVRDKSIPAGTPLNFDGDGLSLVSLSINGRPAEKGSFSATPEMLTIAGPPRRRRFVLEIETEANPEANTKLMGLYRSGGNYCTQCEADGFRRITYFPDRPDVLAVYTTRIEADAIEAPILLSNGNPVEVGPLEGNRHYALWHDPHPKPSYLFALVAGNLEAIHSDYKTKSGRPVKLAIYTQRGKSERARYAMDALIRSMRWDEEAFGREYDLDVFNIVAVPDFNMGAMENKGLNIFNDKYVLADADTATDADRAGIERVIAHEYFHNWTGNRITCRDWFQLCLKEGLTVYRDQEFTKDQRSRAVQRIAEVRTLRSQQFVEDAGPLAHPVRPSHYREINNFYTATVYEKGAELVRMIAVMTGPADFRKGMDLYFSRHDGEAATVEEFLQCFEDAANIDLSQFALWYSQAGTPSLPISATYDRSKKVLAIEIEQDLPATPGQARKRLMHIPLRIGLIGTKAGELQPARVSGIEHEGDLFHVTRRQHRVIMHGIEERPVLSINRGFTAPVTIDFGQSDGDLALLARHDNDPFNRWQAFQNLAIQTILAAVKSLRRRKTPTIKPLLGEIAAETVTDDSLEPAYRALFVTLPGENEIAQTIGTNIDPDAIAAAWRFVSASVGNAIEPFRETTTGQIVPKKPFDASASEAGKRALVNQLLTLGVMADSAKAEEASARQFEDADNMNDLAAALVRIVHFHESTSLTRRAIADFEQRFSQDPLVMDKWFAVQATAPGENAVANVADLMRHPHFALNNPNRVRALVSSFATANPTGFHAASGRGYDLVCNTVAELDGINPQVAARLLTAFRSWKSLEASRRALAQDRLNKLAGNGKLSRDCSDILERMLPG